MVEGYDSMITKSCDELPPADEAGWKLIGFQLVVEEDGPNTKYYWVRKQKPEEERIEINGGAPQDLWARLFEFRETSYYEKPGEGWTTVFMDTASYLLDLGPNRDEAPRKTETRVVWVREKVSPNS